MTEASSSEGWHRYWRKDRLAACVPENPESAAAIESHWTTFFESLPDGSRILDIATGNGVVLLWAVRVARRLGRKFELTGVDAADIDPLRFLPDYRADLNEVTFLGNTAAETMPFADNTFDVVVSQYGLEYAELDSALAETGRVLVPEGQLHWLAHTPSSVVVTQAQLQLESIELLLASHGPFAAMKAFVKAQERGRQTDRAVRDLTASLKAAEAYCARQPTATVVRQLCGGILDTANNFEKYRPDDVSAWLKSNRSRLLGQQRRIADLQSAVLSPDRIATVHKALCSEVWSHSELNLLTVGKAEQVVGQLIHAKKS